MEHPTRFLENSPGQKRRGFALVIVLVLVVLMAVMILAFFLSIKTDSKAATSTAAGQVSRQLADLAVQTVISQIQTATTFETGTAAWASQPGMIRCYDSSGNDIAWYKLYSSGTMVQTSPGASPINLITADVPTQSWATAGTPNYGVFTDINSPVISSSGTLSYPVVDPSVATSIAATGSAVAGFDVQTGSVPGYVSSGSTSATNNPAAMPVRWLYVLKSGTLVPGVAGTTPGQINVPGASGTNPIVGRVAFWTDDETCKINVNTAADGTYFDSPRFDGPTYSSGSNQQPLAADAFLKSDYNLAVSEPAWGEYTRYPGHPAQTRLSLVLPQISGTDSVTRSHTMSQLSPFMQWGGSDGGTLTTFTGTTSYNNPMLAPVRPTPYASLDEWLFSISGSTTRAQNTDLNGNNLLTNLSLNKLHFFLTAASDAPEVTLYGKPRVSIWPINNDFLIKGSASQKVTPLDQMIASVSTLPVTTTGSTTYYFTRSVASSGTYDWNNIPRNQAVMGYLRSMASTPVPGFGGVFNTKYGTAEEDQILTEIFDYVRSTNGNDYSLSGSNNVFCQGRSQAMMMGYASPYFGAMSLSTEAGTGQVVPISISNIGPGVAYTTKGFGRFDTVSEVTMDFAYSGTIMSGSTVDTTHKSVVGVLYVGLYSPSLGPEDITPDVRVEVDGLNTMMVTASTGTTGGPVAVFGTTPANPGSPNRTVYSAVTGLVGNDGWQNGNNYFLWGGGAGPRELMAYKNATVLASGAYSGNGYGLCGIPFTTGTNGTLSTTACNMDIKVYASNMPNGNWNGTATTPPGGTAMDGGTADGGDGYPGTRNLVQEIQVNFPAISNLPVPSGTTHTMDDRINGSNYGTTGLAPFATNDSTRSIIAGYNGDTRLLAAQSGTISVPDVTAAGAAFVKHPNFDLSGSANAHSQRDIISGWAPGASKVGQLVQGVTYGASIPCFSGSINSALVGTSSDPGTTGDFDNGLGLTPDGPYINKPDEASIGYNNFQIPYYTGFRLSGLNYGYFSDPSRLLASPVAFGSLSTGVPINGIAAAPWQTLLFRPQPTHFGTTSPEDELLLDWFWMPVVQPYAISTPMATAGKVNMNYQIAPFTYITRATALAAVLSSEYVLAVPNTSGNKYKTSNAAATYRYPIKVFNSDGVTLDGTDGTFRQFQTQFATGEIYRSASQICDIYLVPTGQSWTSDTAAQTFWSSNQLTGDNSRERPYNGLYSRLTTKSNTYTVHVRAQALRASSSTPAGVWIENPQRIQSEWRGSYTVNRYLNPEDTNIPDFTLSANFSQSLENYYKYRVLETRRFLP